MDESELVRLEVFRQLENGSYELRVYPSEYLMSLPDHEKIEKLLELRNETPDFMFQDGDEGFSDANEAQMHIVRKAIDSLIEIMKGQVH